MDGLYPRTAEERARQLAARFACDAFNACGSLDAKRCQAIGDEIGSAIVWLIRTELAAVRDERDQYADRLEHEQRDHEVTKGYRAHAEQLLADEQRAHLATKGYLAPERPLDELIAEELGPCTPGRGER